MGYSRAGFEIVGVDIQPQPHYPFEFVLHDALTLEPSFLAGFDAVHASPPCQGYVQRNKNIAEVKWPRLIEPVRDMLIVLGKPYVIENVEGAPLLSPVRLCGTMFNLKVLRHRLFETNWGFSSPLQCQHRGTVADGDYAAIYAFGARGRRRGRDAEGNKVRDPKAKPGPEWSVALGIDWMTKDEMREAIPPAYTEHIGRSLREHISTGRPLEAAGTSPLFSELRS